MKRRLRYVPTVLGCACGAYGVLLGVLVFSGYYKPPYWSAFRDLKCEVYSEYLRIGDLPDNLDFLSDQSKALLAEPNGISAVWNETEKSLHYEYEKPQEVNVSLLNLLSFGLVQTGDKSVGEGVYEESIRHNAPLYRDAGLLR